MCYETTKLIANKLELTSDKYTICFQSRLNDNWIKAKYDGKYKWNDPFCRHPIYDKTLPHWILGKSIKVFNLELVFSEKIYNFSLTPTQATFKPLEFNFSSK